LLCIHCKDTFCCYNRESMTHWTFSVMFSLRHRRCFTSWCARIFSHSIFIGFLREKKILPFSCGIFIICMLISVYILYFVSSSLDLEILLKIPTKWTLVYFKILPVRIRVRIPLCVVRGDGMGWSFGWYRKNRGPVSQQVWHDKDSSLSAEHRSKFCSPSLVMVTSPYKWNILERDVKQ
jgi:hypothetical protein